MTTDSDKETFQSIKWLKERYEQKDLFENLKKISKDEIRMFKGVCKFLKKNKIKGN